VVLIDGGRVMKRKLPRKMTLENALLKLEGLMPNAQRTDEGMGEAQINLSLGVPPEDANGWQATFETLEKFGQSASAWQVVQDFGVQVFVRWSDNNEARKATAFWNVRIEEIEPAEEEE
jgi:hypothetical protein